LWHYPSGQEFGAFAAIRLHLPDELQCDGCLSLTHQAAMSGSFPILQIEPAEPLQTFE